jgi:hypothetical protein
MPGQRKSGLAERQLIAERAARLMAEEGIESYFVAKRKAAERLGIKGGRRLPDNSEIDVILSQYQRLFQSGAQSTQLLNKRRTALAAMQALAVFSPRLVGPVLTGTASAHSAVNLHVFTDASEDIVLALNSRSIPFEVSERRVRLSSKTVAAYPCYRFVAGEESVELVVFPLKDQRQAPLSPVDGKPMQRADRAAVEALLVSSEQAAPDENLTP